MTAPYERHRPFGFPRGLTHPEDVSSWDPLVSGLVELADAEGSVRLLWDRDAEAIRLRTDARDELTPAVSPGGFRSLLARFATVVAEETGRPWNAYGFDEDVEFRGRRRRIRLRNTLGSGFSLEIETV